MIKNISEEGTDGDSDFPSGRHLANQKIDFCINTPSAELLIKLIGPKTGEEVLETPDTIQRELNQHTREYKNMAFEKMKQ